jgi:hypothetical protein
MRTVSKTESGRLAASICWTPEPLRPRSPHAPRGRGPSASRWHGFPGLTTRASGSNRIMAWICAKARETSFLLARGAAGTPAVARGRTRFDARFKNKPLVTGRRRADLHALRPCHRHALRDRSAAAQFRLRQDVADQSDSRASAPPRQTRTIASRSVCNAVWHRYLLPPDDARQTAKPAM